MDDAEKWKIYSDMINVLDKYGLLNLTPEMYDRVNKALLDAIDI